MNMNLSTSMRDRSLPAFLLLDEYSRNKLKVNLTSLTTLGLGVLNSLRDITMQGVQSKSKVFLLDGCLNSPILSDLELFKEVFSLEYVFLSLDEEHLSLMKDLADCYKIDPLTITYEILFAILKGDLISLSGQVSESVDPYIRSLALKLQGSSNPDTRALAKGYLTTSEFLESKDSLLEKVQESLIELRVNYEKVETEKNELVKYHNELLKSSINLTRSIEQYEIIFSRDIYSKLDLKYYAYRPKILYLKEYEELIYLESLLDTLLKTFRSQEKMSVKVLQLFDSESSRKSLTLPDRYQSLGDNFHSMDAESNDFLVKIGPYQELLSLLLTNTLGLDLLIIVDRKHHNETILKGDFLQLGMCRNSKHSSSLGLQESNMITNSPGMPYSWEYYKEYKELSSEELLVSLTSKPIIQNLVALVRAERR
jgi:hypothetical protein